MNCFLIYNGKRIASLLILFLAILPGNLSSGEKKDTRYAGLEKIYSDLDLSAAQEIYFKDGIIYALETGNHRIALIRDLMIIQQIGRIGQKKGEFYYPKNFIIDKNGNFIVLDFVERGANRIQVLDKFGKYIDGFLTGTKSWGFGVDSKGKIYLGQPHFGQLITVYNPKSDKIRRFGELLLPSEIYGNEYKDKDKKYKIPMNRINLVIDKDDNIWVCFLYMPVLLKFNHAGELIFKKIIERPGLIPLKNAIWEPSGKAAKQFLSRNIDGYQMTVIMKDLLYDQEQNRIYVLSGNDEILVCDSAGKEQTVIKPDFIKGVLERFFINEQKEIIVRFFFHPELYKLVIKD